MTINSFFQNQTNFAQKKIPKDFARKAHFTRKKQKMIPKPPFQKQT
jgi:uncharacterized protein YifE (UPF0438 family)